MTAFENNKSPYLTLVVGAVPDAPAAGTVRIFFDTADGKFKAVDSAGTVSEVSAGGALASLSDVDLTGLADGDTLVWDDTTSKWLVAAPASGATTLAALTDVDTTGALSTGGQALVYDALSTHKWKPGIPRTLTNYTMSTWTFGAADCSRLVFGTNSSAATLHIPLDSGAPFPDGGVLEICQGSTGQITVVGDSGVTVHAPRGAKTAVQYSVMRVHRITADEWVISGDVTV